MGENTFQHPVVGREQAGGVQLHPLQYLQVEVEGLGQLAWLLLLL